MRKLKLQVQLSIDGFIGGPNGEMDWMLFNWDERLKQYVKELMEPMDTILLGRKLAEGFIPYWTAALNDPNNSPEGAQQFVETPKVVFSRTVHEHQWANTVVSNGDLLEEVGKLKRQEGGDILVYGGAEFVSGLIREGLIDEYHLFVNPVALGKGLSIFSELREYRKLKLYKAEAFDCGITVLAYHHV